uniref:RBPJ-interacting and tubulin-associated protein 1 isoform X2 n=1 Tax=Jaculus jaculus TaxID=51337 RepID=UPI001E1B2FBE|nr:RBPJ-interacting and tubulin-associated protein 1 isoform X2 [Jaculus jaculus]
MTPCLQKSLHERALQTGPGGQSTPAVTPDHGHREELAISGMQTLHLQHHHSSSHRVKARASYVDETLFGSPAGTRPTLPDFDPPWVQNSNRTRGVGRGTSKASLAKGDCCKNTLSRGSTPTLTPRKKNKYRLISHTPSYCDESLFGFRQERANGEVSQMATGDAARLQALFWTPPATPKGGHSPRLRETPMRAVHPTEPSQTETRVTASSGKLSENGLDAVHPPRRERSTSLTHLNIPSKSHYPATCAHHTSGPQHPRPSTSGMTFQSRVTPRARSGSISVPSVTQQGGVPPKPKPPWK